MKIYYSASEQGFYIEGVNQQLPDDAREIEQSRYERLLQDNHKLGMWIDFSSSPPLSREVIKTREQLSAEALQKKEMLIESARVRISIWQTKLMLGRLSDDERDWLNKWLDYIDAVQAIDTSAGSGLVWPVPPDI